MTKITISLTPEQAQAVSQMLDLATRMRMGQLSALLEDHDHHIVKHSSDVLDQARVLIRTLKSLLFPEIPGNPSYGIGAPEVGKDAHIAYEMLKVLERAWYDCLPDKGNFRHSVISGDPYLLNFSGTPRIEYEITHED